MSRYAPPKQSKLSQLFDVVVLMALTFGALYIPLFMGLAGGSKSVPEGAATTWEGMGQNATEIAQYNALGFTDPAAVSDIINARYDYSFSIVALLVMVVIIIAYYALMLKFSETEYREVIAEKFDR
jgi:hypothetical protein